METIIKMWIINKATEMVKSAIYKNEIVNKAKTGTEKFDTIAKNFWENLEKKLEKEKEIDRKWIPNFFENTGEEVLESVLKMLKKELIPSKFIQEIFDLEKKENKDIF